MTFGLTFLPIMACAGAALDFTIYNTQRASLQAAVDAAALSVARLASTDEQSRTELAEIVVEQDFKFHVQYETVAPVVTEPAANDILVTVALDMPTNMLGLVGIETMSLSASATATRTPGLERPLEFVFIMDTTASMHSISATWDDAVDAIEWTFTELEALATPEAPVDMSFLPIGDRVNIGAARTSWLSAPAPPGWNGCVEPAYSLTASVLADEDLSAAPAAEANPGGAAPPPGQVYALVDDATITGGLIASIPGVTGGLSDRNPSYPRCTETLVGPTDNVGALTDAVRAASPSGTGRFDEALAWGWRMVSPDWTGQWDQLGYPADHGDADKVIAIVTDAHTNAWFYEAGGANGSSPSGDTNVDNEMTTEGFAQMQALCQRIKDDGITLYVLLKESYSDSVTPFQACASPGKYSAVTGLTSFQDALSGIVSDVKAVRLKS